MKKITIITVLMSALCFTGCSKFLDVKPEAETTQAELFSTEQGFRDALTGAYIDLKSSNTYGGNLMWGNIEYMVHNWDVVSATNTMLTNLVNANYSDADVKNSLASTYQDLYKVVADVNGILAEIDNKKAIFTDDNYALIKGEALGLRAFAHFDVLRMFGPMPDSGGSEPILPYVKTVSHNITLPISYQDFSSAVLSDLDSAETLMKGVDPLTKYSMAELNPVANSSTPAVVADNFYWHRQVRMNYYAVLALKARVYLWLAAQNPTNLANAATYAQMVIDAKDHLGVSTFRLGTESDRVAGDYTMSPEHIMALSVYDLDATANNTFGETGSLVRSDFNVQDGFYYLNNLFPVAERTSDVRWNGMWAYKTSAGNTNYVKYNKFIQRASNPILQIPMLRLSEMYLILTECAQTKSAAEESYSAYCAQKGIPFVNGFSATDWQGDRKNKLIREYVREFYAEGQTFFAYKRFNVTTLPASWTANYYTGSPARYIVPLPDREIHYNNN